MTKHYFEIENSNGHKVKGDIRIPFSEIAIPVVIFSHGFKGFRNWSFIPYICEKFANHGFISVNYDFSHNGIIDDEKQIYNDEIFRKNRVSFAIDDLGCLIKGIESNSLKISEFHNQFSGDIYLAGHSLGGAVSILTAPKFESVKKISLWASISELNRNTERQKAVWKEKGEISIEIASTGQKLHLDYDYIEDKDVNFPSNVIMDTLKTLNYPVQIIHPEKDLTVNIKEANELKSTESDIRKRELIVIEKAGHTFNCRHPFEGASNALQKAYESAHNFFERTE
jgi:uncharacterized protein